MRDRSQNMSPSTQTDHSIDCAANPRGALGDRIQHRLDVRRRAGDDAQDLTRCGLLLQVDSRCSSWNKRTFSMAITAWSAKVSSKFDLLVR